jgi:hypothetical protein
MTILIIITSLCLVCIIICLLLVINLNKLVVQVCENNTKLYEAISDVIDLIDGSEN